MIWRLATVSELLCLFGLLAVSGAFHPVMASPVSGSVVITSDAAKEKRNTDYADVAVWLESLDASQPVPVRRAQMLQKGKTFSPHLLVVTVGSSVDFPNLDPIFHNAFSSFDGQIFDIGLYPPGTSRTIQFHRTGIVRVFCNIHPTMSAVIVVVDTPYWAITDEDGGYAFTDVRPGKYRLHVFHERSTSDVLDHLSRDVSVGGGSYTIPLLNISESGYLPRPHKNKYGKDYPTSAKNPEYSIPQ
jgi:plastocyanin